MTLFDTHAHYDDDAFDADRDDVLTGLGEKGVGYVVNPGCTLDSSRQALALAEQLRQSLQASREETAGYARTYADIPLVGRTIFDQQLGLYDALLDWLDGFVRQFQAEA